MDRLQKKCVAASAGLHGLLAAVLLFGPAFLAPSHKAPELDVLTVIPANLVDAPFSNPGGNPSVTQQPAAPPPAKPETLPPSPQPALPAPTPKPEPVAKPEPVVPKDLTPPKSHDEPDFTKPATKRGPTVNPKIVVRKADSRAKTSDSTSNSDAEQRAAAKAVADARRRALAGAVAGVGNVASSSTSVEIPSGPGGEAFASYSQVVKTVYTREWIEPREVDDDSATVKASVTIRRDGTVAEARIIQASGNAAVDASVRRTLESVTFVAAFPAGAKDEKRTFTISFNLKAKRQLG